MTEVIFVIMHCFTFASGTGRCDPVPGWGTFRSSEEC